MTRQEQIEQEAKTHSADVLDRHWFKRGAEWADSHPQWIPVEEELPPASCGVISDPVLVFIGNNIGWSGYIREGFYNHAAKEWSYMNRGRTHKVTHWMPLPASPATEGGAS